MTQWCESSFYSINFTGTQTEKNSCRCVKSSKPSDNPSVSELHWCSLTGHERLQSYLPAGIWSPTESLWPKLASLQGFGESLWVSSPVRKVSWVWADRSTGRLWNDAGNVLRSFSDFLLFPFLSENSSCQLHYSLTAFTVTFLITNIHISHIIIIIIIITLWEEANYNPLPVNSFIN